MLAYARENAHRGPLDRLFGALREVALEASPEPLTVFLDEVDLVRSLPFSADEFFGTIRQSYNERAEDPAWKRLTFCLVGSATPADLVADTRLSPFNIGRRSALSDFTAAEAASLAAGLGERDGAAGARSGGPAGTRS